MLAICASASPRCFDYVKGTSGLIVRWEDARPAIVVEGRWEEQTPSLGGLSAGAQDDLT